MSAYDRVLFRGKLMDKMTRAALLQMEQRLGYQLTIIQGCYNPGGVSASAGTHDGGGAVDLTAQDAARKVRVGRDVGFAMWHRAANPGVWTEHIHGILIGNARLSAGAESQVSKYRAGEDGLAGHHTDPNPYRPSPIRAFQYPPKVPTPHITAVLEAKTREERLRAAKKVVQYSSSAKARAAAGHLVDALTAINTDELKRDAALHVLHELEVK